MNSAGSSTPQHQQQLAQWQAIMTMSAQLLEYTRNSNWEQVSALSAERDRRIDAFFRQAMEESLVATVQEGIRKVQEMDEESVRLVQKNKDALAEEISRLQKQKKRVKDYLSNSE